MAGPAGWGGMKATTPKDSSPLPWTVLGWLMALVLLVGLAGLVFGIGSR